MFHLERAVLLNIGGTSATQTSSLRAGHAPLVHLPEPIIGITLSMMYACSRSFLVYLSRKVPSPPPCIDGGGYGSLFSILMKDVAHASSLYDSLDTPKVGIW